MVVVGFNGESELNIDWDHLLGDIPDDLNFEFCDLAAGDGLSPNPACSLSISDIEHYLMDDDGSKLPEEINLDILADDGLFSEALLDSSPGSDLSKDSPADQGAEEKEKGKSHESPPLQRKEAGVVDDGGDDDNDDPLEKKRKRKLMNKDAAVRSRERKKIYVRDLEMKSKYYEAECRRLGNMLQCCLAENQALRLSMLDNKAFDVSMSKQESAVLFLESLLLGSLLGFMGIIYLLILPCHLLSILEAGLLGNEDSGKWKSVAVPRRAKNEVFRVMLCSMMLGKRCKGSRSRMKLNFLLHCTSGFVTK